MRNLSLPLHLLQFWYPETVIVFARTLRNLLLYLEEDLAVGLMVKLLFVPLFHDSTIVGRILSFFFRLFRILLGVCAFAMVIIALLAGAIYWLLLPVLAVILPDPWGLISKGLAFSGIVLFTNHILSHPHKKLWQIKDPTEVWQASFVKKKDIDFVKLGQHPSVKQLLLYLEQTPENIAAQVQQLSGQNPNFPLQLLSERVLELGKQAVSPYLLPVHFYVVYLSLVPNIDMALLKINLTFNDFIEALSFVQKRYERWKVSLIFDEDFAVKHLKGVNRGWLGVPTPALDTVSWDLTKKASKEEIPDFVGRTEVVGRVVNILSLEKGRNVVMVGEPGSGKSGLVEYLAKRIINGDAPPALATKRLVGLDLTKLLSGITSQGELAERVKTIFEEAKNCGNIIIFIDEIHELGTGEVGSQFNLYSLLLPYIESSDFQFIATTEGGNYNRVVEKDGSFARLFAKIELPLATIAETVDILKNQAIDHERYKKIKTSLIAVKAIAELSERYVHDLVLPDSALKVFEECLAAAEEGWVKKSTVEKVIKSRVGVPVGEVETENKSQLLNLEMIIHQKMIDQEQAVSVVAATLRRAAANLREQNRPIGSFLFVGPTGVGKTELAKILAEVYFESKGNFARFDMSEYQTTDSISRLIGDSNQDGILTETVRVKPYSLILLDEFEKADPKVLTLFLQVLDDGRLTGGTGKTADFTETIIIATSNAGSLIIASGLQSGQTLPQIESRVKEELLKVFKPELLNRFDEVVLFKPLSQQDLQKVVMLKLFDLQKQLKDQGYLVDFDEGLVGKLAERGYDPVLGARPLRRFIQDTIEARLSVMILENKLPKGEKFLAGADLLVG